MNFCKAYLLSFLTIFLLSATEAVAEATQSQDEKASFFEGFSSELITPFNSLFSSSQPDSDSNPAMKVKSSKASASSCYDFTLEIKTGSAPENISWKIENANTNETIASQDEGFYTEDTTYIHDESICLDMDNRDICYNVFLGDSGHDDHDYVYWSAAFIKLVYVDEDHNDEYNNYFHENRTGVVCSFINFASSYNCLKPEPYDREPSCACGDIAYCVYSTITKVFCAVLMLVLWSPCILVGLLIFIPLYGSAWIILNPSTWTFVNGFCPASIATLFCVIHFIFLLFFYDVFTYDTTK